MNEFGHLLLLDATVEQLARLILRHGSTFLERHGTTELGPRWMLRCERHDELDISTRVLRRICKRSASKCSGSREGRGTSSLEHSSVERAEAAWRSRRLAERFTTRATTRYRARRSRAGTRAHPRSRRRPRPTARAGSRSRWPPAVITNSA